MNRRARWPLLAAALLLVAGCASTPVPPAVVFVVVRHAEKAPGDAHDPPLSAAGQAHAEAFAAQFGRTAPTAIYATAFRRTQQTAAPVARMHGVEVRSYDARMPAADFAAQLRRDHRQGAVLVVGHSNTVPGIVAALCDCAVAPIDEQTYGDRYDVLIAADGRATLARSTY